MRTLKWFIAVLIIAFSQAAIAGGSSYRVKLLIVAVNPDGSAYITLKPEEAAGPWAGCPSARILVKFEKEPLGRRTWSANIVTMEKHREALAALTEALKSGAVTSLGEMGPGFKTADRCVFESRGLAVLEESDGKRRVYSFYGAI
jgi:hypothetical protein